MAFEGDNNILWKFYRKLHRHFNLYKFAHPTDKAVVITYIVRALLYRRIICHLIALPLLLVYFLLYPFIKFRFIRLCNSAIGHYAMNTELLLCALDDLQKDRFINVFYLENSLFEPYLCNEQLHKMWKRVIIILPAYLSGIIDSLNVLLTNLLGNQAYGLYGNKNNVEHRGVGHRDVREYLKSHKLHLQFTIEEDKLATELLRKINLRPSDKYICLLVRSSAYKKGHPTWDTPERNADLKTYRAACIYLANQGYFVLRMGKVVDDELDMIHPNIIDYAKSNIRCDFMDIYLAAHCHFFITTGSGLDSVGQIFRRPILFTNCHILPYISMWYPHYLFTFKNLAYRHNNNLLTLKEIYYYFHQHPEWLEKETPHVTQYIAKHNIYYLDNTEDEILEAVQEMEARVSGSWVESDEDKKIQERFWQSFPNDIIFDDTKQPFNGARSIKVAARFIAKYSYLLA